ncbi:NACHT, LRR and PYD domains-containing protein 3-like isoform X2 [Alosa sapidissima]|uniref:NACHT, LRR and PYD domains-containing protein 3-like isoform X2 n=1 Tax=Alosa sapidissima TaxID=34773 RepID=UPI001C0897B1|nr:NACHT, LRR and PYD domains-containing protein 3-like isoform X2 [Alosa sapidissima]
MDSDPDGKKRTRDSKVGVSSSDSDSVQQGASGTDEMQRDSVEHRWTPEEAEVHEKFRSTLKSTFQHLVEGIPNQGESRLLQEIYTDLHITEGGGGVNDEHEVRQIERASWREAARGRPIECSNIFKPLLNDEQSESDDTSDECDEASDKSDHRQHKPIRTVLTKGVAGIGKTVSVQKFILDWTEGKNNQDVHFIFPLPFRELNLMKNKKLSLVKLIQHFFPEIKDSKIFTSSEHRVMFIFDGLDECRLPLDFHSKLSCCDVTEPVLVNVLLTNLVKRNLLPSALLWITTRPAAASQIPPECVDQVTEIRGFNDPQKEEYFRKRVRDENLANRTITHLKSSRSLYIMCHIPVFCWISATVVERTSFESENIEMPRTLTQMYTHFLIIQTSLKKAKYTERKETDEEIIFKLGKLAFQQLKEGNLIFYEEDLGECDINVTEASVYSGVCTQIFREESGVYQGKVFSFVHLSIQEFLAALYVFLCFENRERSMTDQHQTSQLSALFRAATLHDLHKTAVDLALQSENGHLDLFLRFLLGLSLESNQNLLMHLLPQTISHKQSSEQTVQYIKQKIRDQSNSGRRINLFYCLNELNHHSVVEKIDRSSGTLFVDTLIPGEWETRRFTFKIPEEQLDEFDLQKYIKTPETDQTELLSPDEVLQRLVPVVTSALLYECSLTEKSCAAIASAARPNSCSLKELNLSDNDLHDAGVQHLSDLLKNPHCKLEKLELSWCSLTENSCAAIASAARSNSCSLKELDLSHNDLHDAGVQHLSELLKNPHCKLEKLVLVNCSLTEKSCAAIASAARSNSCSLKELNLSHNKLHDAGVQHLSELLKNPHCKLETLELVQCLLTEKSCAVIASAARSNSCSLKELNLRGNELHDAGVQHLSELLKNPHCKLETLELSDCFLTEKSCAVIASAARSNSCSLKELNLNRNELHDAGVQHLSELLKNPHCKLEKLELSDCFLTEKSCAVIASAARSNSCSLKELNLSHNELHDAGVQHLSELLKNPHCKLETLVLQYCSLTEKSCAVIASAARSNSCSLKELNLSHNELHDAGVQHLSELLKNPHCKLETLVLQYCSLTEKSCAVIASAARSNSCSLKELNLSHNELHDAGVQHLSELLKNPHCKLEKLQLVNCFLTEKSCAAIASAARSNSCSLKELNLSHNELHDAGVQHLSELLKNPHCKLETLVLSDCFLTEKSCAVIASAARSNSCSLKELNLRGNELHDAGVQHLSELLKNPHCKLEKLEVDVGIFLKESPAAAAASASSSHSDAAELHLRDKVQQDPGAQLLSLDTEDHHSDAPQRSCEFCAEVPDSSHWVLLKPEVSTDESVSTYSLSSPAGSYECSESGLRWTCDGPVTLQYRFTDWHVFAEELAHMQSRPAGPLMDIRVMSGELEEIHLPHYLCLGGFEASVGDAVRVLHGRESGVCVEVCELTRHHARLLHPSFSLLGLVYYLRDLFSPKVHCELLLFCTCTAPLVLQAYLVPTYPNDPAHIRAILQKDVEKEKTGVWIDKPRVLGSLREMDTFCVRTSCPSEIQPEKMNLWPLSTGNFCEVYMEQPEKEFDMEVISSQQPIWTVKIRRRDYCKPSRSPGQGSSQGTNTERLAQVRPGLIRGVSRGVLRSTLDRLQAHRPPVLSSREAEEVLQRSQVLQDQVSCLVDMVHRKGDTACSIMLVLLEELDPHLHGELHL